MKKVKQILKNRQFKILVFIVIAIFTFILRAHTFERSPTAGNLEEMLYAWSGIYLIETGTPVSWSTLDYPKRAQVFRGVINYKGGKPSAGVSLYKPWLDEPPLFSLLVGWFAHIYHADRTQIIPTAYIRTPMIFIGFLTSIFVFLIARFISGFWSGILAMFLYSTTPIFVLGSRIAVPENLISLLYILTIYLILYYLKNKQFKLMILITLVVGIAGLSKPTGFLIAPIAIYFALFKKDYKAALFTLFGTFFFVIVYILYGLHYDAEIFWRITRIQSFRPVGFSSLAWFLISPAYDWRMLIDSWYVFFMASAIFFIFSKMEGLRRIIIFSFVYWIIVVMISGGEGDLLAWYRYPAFPLLAIMGSWGIFYLIKNPNFFTSFLANGLLLGNKHLLVNAFNPEVSPLVFRLTFGGLMLPSLLSTLYQKDIFIKLSQALIIIVIIVGIYFNVKYIYNEYEILCQGAECLFGPSTTLSVFYFPIIHRLFSL